MKKSEKEYFKHFAILFLIVCTTIVSTYIYSTPIWFLRSLIIVGCIYILLFSAGTVFNIGPFKYISKLYTKEREQELQSMRPKQPWE